MNILAIIPISHTDPEFKNGKIPQLGEKSVLDWTFDAVKDAERVDGIVVATDSEMVAEAAQKKGLIDIYFRDPFERPLGLVNLYQDVLKSLYLNKNYKPQWVTQFWMNYPFRAKNIIDDAIKTVIDSDSDSAFLASSEYNTYWKIDSTGKSIRITTDDQVPRDKRPPVYRDLKGLFSMTRSSILENNIFFGSKTVILPVNYFGSNLNLHDVFEKRIAYLIASNFREELYKSLNLESAGKVLIGDSAAHRKIRHKSLIFSEDVRKGEIIKEIHLTRGDSDIGISEALLPEIAEKTIAAYNIKKGEPVTFGLIEWISQ